MHQAASGRLISLLSVFVVVNVAPAVPITITSPVQGSAVARTITVRTRISSPAVAKVAFYVDAADRAHRRRVDYSPPYTFSWNTRDVADGRHSVLAISRNRSGRIVGRAQSTVTVRNGTLRLPPLVPPVTPRPAPTPPPSTSPPAASLPPRAPLSSAQTWLYPFRRNASIWTTPLPGLPPLDPQSSAKVSFLLANSLRYPNIATHSWGVPVIEAPAGTPLYQVACLRYACNLNQFGGVPIPLGAKQDPTSDGHLAIWEPSTHREFDFWIAQCCWTAGSGGVFSTDGTGVGGTTGADAANFPMLGGVIRPEEIRQGHIDHALAITFPNTGTGHVCPASGGDGKNPSPNAIREGSLLQLDPALNLDALALKPWEKTVARALQGYGAYVQDTGGTLSFTGENPINRPSDPWPSLGMPGEPAAFSAGFPWNHLRVLAPPAPWC
jgi:Big-like domain-containing protein